MKERKEGFRSGETREFRKARRRIPGVATSVWNWEGDVR